MNKTKRKYLIYEITKRGKFLHMSTSNIHLYRAKLKKMNAEGRKYLTLTKLITK